MKNNEIKRKTYSWTKRYINSDNIRMLILFIPLMVLLLRSISKGNFTIEEFADVGILTSFLFVLFCDVVAKRITNFVQKNTEDAVKLSENYSNLVKKYTVEKSNMISENGITFPEIELWSRKLSAHESLTMQILPSKNANGAVNRYRLPKQIADNSAALFKAHAHSVVYNNVNIRLDDFQAEGNALALKYEFTTYYDSLLTNRAMDFPFQGSRTVREIYEPGPILSELNESKLSNHLGFNGFVRFNDGKIAFVFRGKDVSIGKGIWAQSVGASLKAKYCLNARHELTLEGLSNAIAMEIQDELKIQKIPDYDYSKTIIAFYRDLVEGGKPQFLFFYDEKRYTSEEFMKNFKEKIADKEERKENKAKLIIDGEKFAFFTLDELKQCTLHIDALEVSQELKLKYQYSKKMKMMPSSMASIVLMMRALEE